jgi:hypothetical protein
LVPLGPLIPESLIELLADMGELLLDITAEWWPDPWPILLNGGKGPIPNKLSSSWSESAPCGPKSGSGGLTILSSSSVSPGDPPVSTGLS